jgi:hypothetical protein
MPGLVYSLFASIRKLLASIAQWASGKVRKYGQEFFSLTH